MNYLLNKEQYLKLKENWKQGEKFGHTKSDMIAYNILRGFDPKRGFSAKTNAIKLANGMRPWQAFEFGKNDLKYHLRWNTKNFASKWGLEQETIDKMTEALK